VTTTTQVQHFRLLEREGAPAIDGLSARFFSDASDYAPLAALFRAASEADDVPWQPTAQQVQLEFDAEDGADPVHDVVLVEVGGHLVAATGVERAIRDGTPNYEMWGSVDPAFRRRGIGTWLMAWALDRARERASREDPLVAVKLASFSEDNEIGHRALLAGVGLEPVRHFFLMRRPLSEAMSEAIPDAPLPDGLEIRPVTQDQWRAIFDAENEAFRDHWGHREGTERAFQTTYAHDELDTSLWVVAWDGDQIAGVVQNWIWPEENRALGVERGWLEHISVRRPWRRRGLARAITAESLRRFRDRGLEDAMLGVDSENPNGALGLYEGLGFALRSRAAAYRRPLER
jgi:mycothiol synthase